MFLVRRPSSPRIDSFLRESAQLPLSYSPVGIAHHPDGSLRLDEVRIAIGRGDADFARACAALRAWRQFDLGWIELHPRRAPIAIGTNVAVLIRHLGFWSLNGCRVVDHVSDERSGRWFGYAYATLPTHAELGEELFEVSLDAATGEVWYSIRAASRPRARLARLGGPVVRRLQARFRRDSVAAMRRATAGTG